MKKIIAKVEAVLVAKNKETFVTNKVKEVKVDFGGIPGDRHYGLTRPADVRQFMYKRGTEILNRRQISIVSVEDCQEIATELGVEQILPEWLGANLLINGLPNLTKLSMGSRLLFPSGVGLVCNGENQPCRYPGEVVQENYPHLPNLVPRFIKAAQNRRGIVCSVEWEQSKR